MATHTYSKWASKTVGRNAYDSFTIPAFQLNAGEQAVRYKITRSNSSVSLAIANHSYDTWYTDFSAIGWTDGSTCRIDVRNTSASNQSCTVTVTFETQDKPTYAVTCKTSGSGTLKANPTTAYQGRTVTLTATPATGSKFSKYTSSPSVTISNNKFTMPASAVTITAKFTSESYAVAVVSEDTEKGTATGSGNYAYESSVAIEAIAKPGYKFTNWTKTGSGTIENANAASTTFTVGAGAGTVTAHFERSQSVIDYYHDGEFRKRLVSYYKDGEFHDCDVQYYHDGAWHQCSDA